MFLRSWRWLTPMFVALSLAPALGHLLEMPAETPLAFSVLAETPISPIGRTPP
jgi:hypothetical protein